MNHPLNTTHTIEMEQIADLNHRLKTPPPTRAITAADLGLEGATMSLSSAARQPGAAVLVRLCWDGPPEWPYVHGHFSTGAANSDGSSVVDFHTHALRELSHRLGAHHVWGIGSVP